MEAKDIIHPEDAKAIKAIKGKYDTGRCLELPGIVS